MKRIKYFKYSALGNDFLIVDLLKDNYAKIDFNDLALNICDRHFGVGADGIMVLSRSKKADCCLDLFNSDGSWAEKSGNGLRASAAYYYSYHSKKKNLIFEINDELATAGIIKKSGNNYSIQVTLGKPEFETTKIPMKSSSKFHINEDIILENNKFPVTVLSVGNPHTVMFVNSFDFDWKELGEIIENCKYFPNRTNVEFGKIASRSKIILNDWERGAGATGSSGTGAAAAVVAGVVNGFVDRKAEVVFPSGSLFLEWNEKDDIIYLTGPVLFICSGEYIYNPA
ncbi:MAG: diaminopimelate epimerase [Candidatus Zixiibacteriota bacterium]